MVLVSQAGCLATFEGSDFSFQTHPEVSHRYLVRVCGGGPSRELIRLERAWAAPALQMPRAQDDPCLETKEGEG